MDRHAASKKVEKALTAGYGGAGMPTSNTGGGVLQEQKIDIKPSKVKGFKNVTCQKCGSEQIHSQHQVRCRKCGKNFSLEQLYKLLS
jgi:ribosomal protein S27AE